jgi:thiol:disulfide interchange protein DsbD
MLQGTYYDYIIVFLSGVAVSFTPCVYPLLPVTATLITKLNKEGRAWKGFLLSVLYVSGMAISYSILAIFAALTGRLFGELQNNPWAFLLIGNILILFALDMWEMIPFPTIRLPLQDKVHVRNMSGVLLFGFASGFVISPCMAPVLGTLLLYIASRQNVFHGISLLLVFAYGVGASLILVGTFSSVLARLPKAGHWMVWVERITGLAFLIMAEYFLIKAGTLFNL